MIRINEAGKVEDTDFEDSRSVGAEAYNHKDSRVPRITLSDVNPFEIIRNVLLQVLDTTTGEYDRATSWEEHLIVKTERSVITKIVNLLSNLEKGEGVNQNG